MSELEPYAYSMEVEGPLSQEWTEHLVFARDVPDNPMEVWRDDHNVRNVVPLFKNDQTDTQNGGED